MIHFIGSTFPEGAAWHCDEVAAIAAVQEQIAAKFPADRNLLINTTWFGPQFDNGDYDRFTDLVNRGQQFDRVFLLAAADPVFLNPEQIADIVQAVHADHCYLIGHFDSQYQFNFHAIVLGRHFADYTDEQLLPTKFTHLFLNYNRKPRAHRVQLVNKLIAAQLDQLGIVTLGTESGNIYNQSEPVPGHFTVDPLDEFKDSMGQIHGSQQFGIPDDIHTVGNLVIWQEHFLNIVSETEFLPWDNTFVSEKTWKPIIGLRPFLINGQAKIYSWLRDQGFRTFTHFFPGIELEAVNELEVHDSIVQAVEYLRKLTAEELMHLYQQMLPDLQHNRQRFFEFAQEQEHRMRNIL